MKLINVFASLLISSQLISHENYQHVGFKADSRDLIYTQLNLEHQTHFEFKDDNFAILSLGYKPFLNRAQHFEGGFGYRKFFRDVGFGTNFSYSSNNRSKVYLHQVSPGVELFAGKYHISANHYLPFKKQTSFKGRSTLHHAFTEIGVVYRASGRFEVGIFPFFNHATKDWGYNSTISLTVQDSLQIGLSPFYKSGNHGFLFSFGVNFGGKRDRKMQPIRKTNDFFYTREKPQSTKPRATFVPPFVPESPIGIFIPVIEVKEDKEPVPQEKEEIENVPIVEVPKAPDPVVPQPIPPKSWWDRLFQPKAALEPKTNWQPDFSGMSVNLAPSVESSTPLPTPTPTPFPSIPRSESDSDISGKSDSPIPYSDPSLGEWVTVQKK